MKDNLQLFYDFCQNSKKAHDIDPALSYMREVVKEHNYTTEETVWWCFLYAVTYDLAGSFILFNELPHPADLGRFDPEKWIGWWKEYQSLVPYQKDKIKQRVHLIDTIMSYKILTEGQQYHYLKKVINTGGKGNSQANFDRLWFALQSVSYFGRFSIWNFLQALHEVALMDIEPPTLMIGEPDAVALTDGLAFAFGLTDLVTKKVTDPATGKTKKIYHKWTDEEKDELEQACILLRSDLKLDNFQLETLASSFMKLFRSNDSRYVGYHNDRLADEIRINSKVWKIPTWDDLWKVREKVVPSEYLHNNSGVNKDWMKLPADKKIYL